MISTVDTETPNAAACRLIRPCIHCGEPTRGPADQSEAVVFCCNGCRGAYELIHGWGLDGFYELRGQVASTITPTTRESSRYDDFDSADFLGSSAPKAQPDGLLSVKLAIRGLHCAACAWLIENAAARTRGWHAARVKMSDHSVRILFDPKKIKLSEIARLMDRLGYELAPLDPGAGDHFERENRQLLIQIAIAGFCAANAMWIAIALYAGDISGVAASHRNFLQLFGTGLGVAAVAFPGRTFFRGALASLQTRTPHMDLPVALGLAVGTIAGILSVILRKGDLYFDSLAALVFLLLIGRWVQFRQQHRAAKAVDLLLRITPRHASRVRADKKLETVVVDRLQNGDIIRVNAGDSIAADGQLVAGASMIDRSLLTGESAPVAVAVGNEVFAGTVNLQRPIDVRVGALGRESRIGRVMQSVEEAASQKTPIVQLADRIGGVFVVVVTILAILTFAGWVNAGWTVAVSHSTALLIVACPCALALATPLAIAVSIGRASKRKILIRDGSSLQHLATPGTIWFDKTGTLTEGRLRADLIAGDANAIAHAAAIETGCNHAIATAIILESQRRNLHQPTVTAPTEVHVGGVSGASEGHRVLVGNLDFICRHEFSIDNDLLQAITRCLEQNATPILIAIDGAVTSVLAVHDRLKDGVKETLADLTRRGWKVGILSGDHPNIVRHVAQQVGVDEARALGGLSPEEKLSIVRGRVSGTIVMVGDGANDAAALAAADVGIAVRGGAEVSLQAAPVYISSGEIPMIGRLMQAARRTWFLIATTFAVSLGYNSLAVILAMSGQITPLIAAILMPISSISVLTLTLAWPTFRGEST